jgi:hypothetical protein
VPDQSLFITAEALRMAATVTGSYLELRYASTKVGREGTGCTSSCPATHLRGPPAPTAESEHGSQSHATYGALTWLEGQAVQHGAHVGDRPY